MPFNGSGTYNPPGADFPAVTATIISSSKYNNVINDIGAALTNCVTRDGQSPWTGTQNAGGQSLSNLGAGSAASPAIRFANGGGFYSTGANTIAMAVGSTLRVLVDANSVQITPVTSNAAILTSLSQNNPSYGLSVVNGNAGNAAEAIIQLSNATHLFQIRQYGTAHASGPASLIYTTSTTGLWLYSFGAAPIRFATNNLFRWQIDSSGRLLNDGQTHPGFSYHLTNNITSLAAATAINFDSMNFNRGGNYSAGTFTAPVAGIYHFSFGVTFNNTSGSQVANNAGLYVNGVLTRFVINNAHANNETSTRTGSAYLSLAANDTVFIGQTVGNISASNFISGSVNTWFSGWLVA